MKSQNPLSTREDILDAFAVEPNPNRETLERYLRLYPAFAADLVDLSIELFRKVVEDDTALSLGDVERIDEAWSRHRSEAASLNGDNATSLSPIANPLAALSVEKLRALANALGIPRQVLTAFRERRVDVATVPRVFLRRMAEAVGSTRELLAQALDQPAAHKLARNYKSDVKPFVDAPVAFEQLLRDAGVSDAERSALLKDEG